MIAHEIYRRSRYGEAHPLSIPRVSTCVDLCRALDWLPDDAYRESEKATPAQLTRFHTPDYVAALQAAERDQAATAEVEDRYRLNREANPIFPEVFSRPATACGAGLMAVEMLRGGGVVHSPAGGTHHGRPDRASGFCYLNDPVITIYGFLDAGARRVLYVDLDAHRGDGVEDAFADDPRVLTISIHENGRWPGGGGCGWRPGAGALNLPLPEGAGDADLAYAVGEGVLPWAESFAADVLVLQCGADGVLEDPLSRLAYTNQGIWDAVAALLPVAPRRLVLGGGGYNPWSVGRCWAGIWGLINDAPIPDRLPPAAEAVLRGLTWRRAAGRNPPEHWFTTLRDAPRAQAIDPRTRAAVAAAREEAAA